MVPRDGDGRPLSFHYFGGIDFSGAKEPLSNLWSALGEERDGRLHVLALCPHPFRADLCSYAGGGWRRGVTDDSEARILWGADFPFGLPDAASRRVTGGGAAGWEACVAWVADRPADEVRDAVPDLLKTGRATDTGGAMAPMDLRLYKQTVEGMRWLHTLREECGAAVLPQAPDGAAATTVIEVYPSGAVKELGIKGSRVPSRPGEVRARPAGLRPFLSFDHPSLEALAVTLEDARDACIAALVAWLCRDDLDQPFRLARAPRKLVESEGWIYRPPATLG